MSGNRYAILIGVNDYHGKPLSYCLNDVTSLKEMLLSRCKFESENIFEITSSTEKSNKNLFEEFKSALNEIRSKFISKEDSILFYFSGHGEFSDQTVVEFHEDKIPLKIVYQLIETIKPKDTIFIIDACHSGNMLELKGNAGDDDFIRKLYHQQYITSTEGFYLMCACKADEKASAVALKNSIYTHYLVTAINNNNIYDKSDYSVSLDAIHEFASKQILLERKYKQTPYMQKVASGYLPFGIIDKLEGDVITKCEKSIGKTENVEDLESFFKSNELNMSDELKRDLIQLLSEISLNAFEKGFASSVDLKIIGNKIILEEHNHKPFNPFEALETEDGKGIKVVKYFTDKYKSTCLYKYVESGSHRRPNLVILEFKNQTLFTPQRNECYVEITKRSLFERTEPLDLKLGFDCEEVIIDITKCTMIISLIGNFLDEIVENLKPNNKIVFIKTAKNDMSKKFLKDELQRKYRGQDTYNKIIVV